MRMNAQIKTILLMGFLSALLIGIGGAIGSSYLYGFAILAVALNVGAYFFSDRIVLKMHRAREVTPTESPWLHKTVEELAVKAEIPKPKVYLIEEEGANAFATGRNPSKGVVAVTEGIMRLLNQRELRGVLAHELAHIKNRDTLVSTIAASIAATITYIANALQFGALFGGGRSEEEGGQGGAAGGLLLAFIAPLAATLVQLGISRSREFYADEAGARISGDPEALARALEKLDAYAHHRTEELHEAGEGQPSQPATASLFIVNPFAGGGGMMRWFSTHPATEERVRRLREMAYGFDWAA